MPSVNKIGVQVGVDGYDQFSKTISNIVKDIKELKSEAKVLESEWAKEGRTIKQNIQYRDNLKQSIEQTKKKYEAEMATLQQISRIRQTAAEKGQLSAEYYEKLANEENKYNIQANKTLATLNDLQREFDESKTSLELFADAWKNASSNTGEILKGIGGQLTKYVTVPIMGATAASIKAATDWETAFTGVKKTNEEVRDSNDRLIYSYDMLEDELKQIGLVTGSSLSDIASVAEISGQLGVATQEVAEFTQYVIELADSTNLTAESGASYMATILNLMNHGMPIAAEQAKQLGSAIVYLGNNYNTTENDIAAMATRLAPAAAQLEFTTADVLALATAMSTAQITAEGGGTAMTQVMTNITKSLAAFRSGAESTIPRIAEISGMGAEEFANAWETKPIEALDAFITGLSKLDENGEYTAIVFDELGMAGVRQSLSLNALALTHEQLSKAIADSNREYKDANALEREASMRYETTASQVQQLKNSLVLLGDSFGKMFLPTIKNIVEGLTQFFTTLSQMDEGTKTMIITIAGLLAAVGPLIMTIGNALIYGAKLKASLDVLGISMATIGTTISSVLLPLAAIIAGFTALYLVVKNWDSIKEFVSNLVTTIIETISAALSAIWDGITTIGANIWNVLSALGNSILSGLLSLLENMVAKLMLFALTTLPTLVKRVISLITDAKANIKNTFDNLVSSAWSWGRDMIGNLISGIRSKISSLMSSVSEIASTIWSYLHFSEPEKGALANFHTWMPDMMRSMAEGIEDNMYLVDNAIGRVADTLGMGGTTNNYGGVVINLNVPQGANGQPIVDEIETELANRTLRRKAVFG